MNRRWARYGPALLVPAVQVGVTLWYVLAGWATSGAGFPFDDGWIHAVFARNLAQYGAIGFYPGMWTGGTSSLLWILLLAPGYWVGLSAPLVAALVGTMAWGIAGLCVFTLLHDHLRSTMAALVWSLLLVVVGPFTYLALSGMETPLFLALSLLAVAGYSRRRYGLAGVWLALLVLTRIEGLALVGVLALATWIRHGRATFKPVLRLLLPPLITLLSYGIYNVAVTGYPLPATMNGRKWLWGLPDQLIVLNPKLLAQYVDVWRVYVEGWLFHSFALPNPWQMAYRALLWGCLLLGLGILLIRTAKGIQGRNLSGILLVCWWAIGHNMIYLLFSPFPSIRHQMPNLLLVVFLLALTYQAAHTWLARSQAGQKILPIIPALVLGLGLLPSVRDWQVAYADHVALINQVHAQAGRWINTHMPANARVAAFDIGAVAYFGQRYTLDLGGLIEADFAARYLYSGQVADYLQRGHATYLALPEVNTSLSGMGHGLGLADIPSTSLTLNSEVTFRVEPRVPFPFDALPYYYYLPALWQMTIYDLDGEQP
jgi:hypothetical protein